MTGAVLALTLLIVAGCATAPSQPLPPAKALQPADLKSLAGEWEGTLRGVAGTGPFGGQSTTARITVAPDGSYTSSIQGRPGAGKAMIQDGKIVFQGSTTKGTATLHEGGGRQVIKGEGTWVGVDGQSTFEMTRR
jgi:hypothetical protein